jgi:hypothetical protein
MGDNHENLQWETTMKISLKSIGVAFASVAVAVATLASSSPAQAQAAPGYRQATNIGSGKCLDVKAEDNYYVVGARIQQWNCTGVAEQQWSLGYVGVAADGNQVWQLKSQRSGLCMSVLNASYSNGAQIVQSYCPSSAVDWYARATLFQMTLRAIENNRLDFVFVSHNSGKCLDLNAASTSNGAKIQQYDCNGTDAQHWRW